MTSVTDSFTANTFLKRFPLNIREYAHNDARYVESIPPNLHPFNRFSPYAIANHMLADETILDIAARDGSMD